MLQGIPLKPEQASTIAQGVDYLYYFLSAIGVFFSVLIFVAIFYFVIRYRRREEHEIPEQIEGNLFLELTWTVIPLGIVGLIFLWGTVLFVHNARPPERSMEIFVVGKQWMWKVQHPEGVEEINELHVPVNQPVKLTMTSEDVIHDFAVPAFRIKKDVVPGMYTTEWFQATKTGTFHLFCDQYCGTNHSLMKGSIIVMEPADYEQWLSGGIHGVTMVQAGAKLYEDLACVVCHGTGKGPALLGIYNKPVKLEDGRTVIADDAYLRESVLYPTAKIVDGFRPIMPTFKGQVTEEQLLQLIAYIKSLATQPSTAPETKPAAAAKPPQAPQAPPAATH
jgi:cytochrome c oxidase subunit II